MAKLHSRSWVWHFDSPPERIWPLLADTARFNEAADLPKHEIIETPRPDGSVEYVGRARKGPFQLVWEERPVNWVSNQWFEHCRTFRSGPLESLCAHFRLEPEGGGCRGTYILEASASNLLGELMLRTAFFGSAGANFARLAETAKDCAAGRRPAPFDYEAPAASDEVLERIERCVAAVEESGHGHGLARRLADLLLQAQEVDLTQLRPLRLAREWQVQARDTIELCLEATRQGLLTLRWDLLCPRCRIAKSVVPSLDQLPTGSHCDSCNIDYDRDFSRNVELSFQPAQAVRPMTQGEYCLFGPMSTPHIHVHLTLQVGETREEAMALVPGRYRLRTLEPGPEIEIDWEGGGFPTVIAGSEGLAAGEAAPEGSVRLRNESARPLTLIVEECAWVRDALTADRASSLQAFRDLFSEQVLRPGDEVSIRRIALLFSDLAGSTALYDQIGDASAYHLVRDHFAFLAGLIRKHDGAIVKTIGDAVMAAFHEPAEALQAALETQAKVADFNAEHPETPIVIKLGLHEGPCIAVTLNERLDYFGSTVNLAARLQGQSLGGDIVLSEAMATDRSVGPLLAGLDQVHERAMLKGFDEPVGFLRLSSGAGAVEGAVSSAVPGNN